MINIEYIMSTTGETKAIVIPIEIWKQILPGEDASIDEISQALEDYCLSKAMDEGQESPLLNRDEALKYLEE